MSDLSFDLTAKDLEPSNLSPILDIPIIAKFMLIGYESHLVKEQYEVFDLSFECMSGEKKGFEFRHRIFEFSENETSDKPVEEQRNNWGKHIAYILSYFINEKNALTILNESNDWNQLRANIQKALEHEKLQAWKKKVIMGKVLGFVTTKGQAVLGFPRYLGFIADDKSEKPLAFSRRERQENARYAAQYKAELEATADEEVGAGGAEVEVEAGVDF